jgi:hypothetical protein
MTLEGKIDKVKFTERLNEKQSLVVHRGKTCVLEIRDKDKLSQPAIFEFNNKENRLYVLIREDVPRRIRSIVIAHEIAESIYGIGDIESEGHQYAIQCEREYAKKFSSPKVRREFYLWREKIGY